MSRSELIQGAQGSFAVRYLWYWRFGHGQVINSLLLYLKGGGSKKIWVCLSEMWETSRYFDSEKFESSGWLFIPAPSSDDVKYDHAYEWAVALSNKFGGEVAPLFYNKAGQRQKRKSKKERDALRIVCSPSSLRYIETQYGDRTWVFVDDIVASGATARAAYLALNCPRNFEVWSLGFRSPCTNG